MRKALLPIMLGAAFVLAACGSDSSTTTDSSKPDGEVIVMKSCSTCHGGQLQGMHNTPSLNDVGSRLTEEEILAIIENGTSNGMPGGLIKGEDAKEAAKWLSEQK